MSDAEDWQATHELMKTGADMLGPEGTLALHAEHIHRTLAKINRDAKRLIRLESMLILCRKRFLEYAEHHRAKDPPDVEKAQRNEEIAVVIESVLYPTNADVN